MAGALLAVRVITKGRDDFGKAPGPGGRNVASGRARHLIEFTRAHSAGDHRLTDTPHGRSVKPAE
jgi:hypothetical protein